MSQNQIQLDTTCILSVPLQTYDNDFSFIVNGEEFKTSRLISDLLSPVIHHNDPTCSTFTINTKRTGNFSRILNLFNFEKQTFPESELPFIVEIIQILENDSIKLDEFLNYQEITTENVFNEIEDHEKFPKFYSKRLLNEIEFISSHFFELCETKKSEFLKLDIHTILAILNNDQLRLKSEDQLLNFVNDLYVKNVKYSILYETVFFSNVSSAVVEQFVDVYDFNDLNASTWRRISNRLKNEIKKKDDEIENERYNINKEEKETKDEEKKGMIFVANDNDQFTGIINYLRKQSNNQIENELNITSSSVNTTYYPANVVLYEDQDKYFDSQNQPNNWICFEFKNHSIIPTDYKIRSTKSHSDHPKNWVIEGSNDQNNWEIIDEIQNSNYLNGTLLIHAFKIQKQITKSYQFIRMRSTGPDCGNRNYLSFDSFEIYGTLI